MSSKVCTRCQRSKPLDSFGTNKRGILSRCTSCSEEDRDRQARGKEALHIATLNAAVSLREFSQVLETLKDNEYRTNSITYGSLKDVFDICLAFSGDPATQLDPSMKTGLGLLNGYSDHLFSPFHIIFLYSSTS